MVVVVVDGGGGAVGRELLQGWDGRREDKSEEAFCHINFSNANHELSNDHTAH